MAAQLPCLRSLDLRCCSEAAPKASTHDLVLTSATSLTHLRLHLSTTHPTIMQRLRMPPHLQAIDVTIVNNHEDPGNAVMALINTLPLQHLASLSVLNPMVYEGYHYLHTDIAIQLPEALPWLRRLHFAHFNDWDTLHRALWPLVDLAARGASSRAAGCVGPSACAGSPLQQPLETRSGDDWRLDITVCELQYMLTAADILRPPDRWSPVYGAMCGHLQSACFSEGEAVRMLGRPTWGSPFLDNLLDETQLKHLSLGDDQEAMLMGDRMVELADFSRLAALRHLDATVWWQLSPDDCRAVAQLQHLTALELPKVGSGEASQEDVLACLRCLTNLRQLSAHLEWTPDTLAALASLTMLTKLRIVAESSSYFTSSSDADDATESDAANATESDADGATESDADDATESDADDATECDAGGATESDADGATEQLQRHDGSHSLEPCPRRPSLPKLHLRLRHLTLVSDMPDDAQLAAALSHMPDLQKLEIRRNSELTGSSLKELPRCCPGLRVLRLRRLLQLEGGFLPALQQLEAGRPARFDDLVAGFLASLPLLRAPLRCLILSCGPKTTVTGVV